MKAKPFLYMAAVYLNLWVIPLMAAEPPGPLATTLTSTADAMGTLPEITAETLAERKVTLPRDLPGERTLVLMNFEREQEKASDTWIVGLGLRRSTVAWAVVPVIEKQNAFVAGMITSGMRMGTSDLAERDRTIPLFENQKRILTAMKFKSGTKSNYAVVVDRAGHVLAVAQGDFSSQKAISLLAALGTSATSNGR